MFLKKPIINDWFQSWDLHHIKRLFLLLVIIASVVVIQSLSEIKYIFSWIGSGEVFVLPGFIVLLLAIHIHYMMVRSETTSFSMLRPSKREYMFIVHDIMFHKEFMKLKEFDHHNGPIYDHVRKVSYVSYSIAKIFSFNYSAAARGGLLHDFFLYDWRTRKAQDPSRRLHGREHPYIAYANASKYFTVSKREEDIIVKHMFPKTLSPPRYIESVIVSTSDKAVALLEFCKRRKLSSR